jgi:hypothetical protein
MIMVHILQRISKHSEVERTNRLFLRLRLPAYYGKIDTVNSVAFPSHVGLLILSFKYMFVSMN